MVVGVARRRLPTLMEMACGGRCGQAREYTVYDSDGSVPSGRSQPKKLLLK